MKDFTPEELDDALIAWGYDRASLTAWCRKEFDIKGERVLAEAVRRLSGEPYPKRTLVIEFKKANVKRESFDTFVADAENAPPAGPTPDEQQQAITISQPASRTALTLVDEGTGETQPFDPRPFISRVQGDAPYLEVKWKVKWLRAEYPDAVIETHCIEISDAHAVFKAKASIPSLGASAEGHARETKAGFGDYAEKAETSAIGRALGFLGYDLEFLPDAAPPPLQPRRTSTRERR